MNPNGQQKEPWPLSKRARGPILRRLVVVVLLIDLVAMLPLARKVSGDLVGGFYWGGTPGNILFPIPIDVNSLLPLITPLTPIDQFVYVVFIWNGLWVAWTAVAVFYIVYPYLLKLRSKRKKT